MLKGQCHCGAIRYQMPDGVERHAVCHCTDCRRATGAPLVSWAVAPADAVTIEGTPKVYASSEHARRHFCGDCGTSLFYTNEVVFPGLIDVQTATLDDPGAIPLRAQIQIADRISWMADADKLPMFARFPGED